MACAGAALGRTSLMMMLCFCSATGRAQQDDDLLPPPPDAQAINQQGVYHLALVVNHYETGLVIPVQRRDGGLWASSADLQRGGIPVDKLPQGDIALASLPESEYRYDSVNQKLLLTVPKEWVPEREVTFGNGNPRVVARSGQGALLNYDFYANSTEGGTRQASVWHELRFFNDTGSLSSTGTVRQNLGGADGQPQGYTRYDTTYSINQESSAITWSLGDVISDGLSWSNSVRVGGITVGRDFSLRPDLVTWPVPVFSGEAAVPTSVDLFINGYRTGSSQLEPGPFTLTNLPYVNGAGYAVVVTTDALGRQVSTTLPFYVASELLQAGLNDGALTLGALRRNYGIENFDYGPAVGSASWRHGVTDYWTAETHLEGAESLALGGVGSLVKLGQFGVANGAWTHSRVRGRAGEQINWGYQYSASRFNLATQHTRRSQYFSNLALYDRPAPVAEDNQPVASLSRSSAQYSLSYNMGEFGNLGAAWLDIESFDDKHTRLVNLFWSKNIWANSSLYLSASHDPARDGWSMAMSLQIPLGRLHSAAVSVESTPDGGSTQRVNYNRAMPSDGGFSYNLAYARQSRDPDYQQATLGWRNNKLEAQGGVYGDRESYTSWGELRGALVMMDNKLFAANQINDAFAVISTDGQPDITVNFENQPVGKTDNDGYLLISGVTAYYPANYSIDTLDLPADTRIKETDRRLALRRNSGYLVEFPMEQERVVNVILHDENNAAIPVSSQILRRGQPPTPVGYDGLAFLESVGEYNVLDVTLPDGRQCRATLVLDKPRSHRLETEGPIICKGLAP